MMGSSSKLTADAFMSLCSSFTPSPRWQYLWAVIRTERVILFLSVPTAIVIYVRAKRLARQRYLHQQFKHQEPPHLQQSMPYREEFPSSPTMSLQSSVQSLPSTPSPVVDRREVVNHDENELVPVRSETMQPDSLPLSTPFDEIPPRRMTNSSESIQTNPGSPTQIPQVHIFCTHIEQKLGKNGLISSITRPSFHVPVTHFSQLQASFAASSERAFFNSQQEVSPSPIMRDPRWLDVQYRLSAPDTSQTQDEVSFDNIVQAIRTNKRNNKDTTIYVQVIRVKDIVPSVLLTFTYQGQRRRPTNAMSLYYGEEAPSCTKIVDFKPHLIRIKHLSSNSLLWDCARHVVKSLKHDHGIVLQTRDIAIEIFSQDHNNSGLQPHKMESSKAVESWMKDSLSTLLIKSGNVVQLQVWAYKKA